MQSPISAFVVFFRVAQAAFCAAYSRVIGIDFVDFSIASGIMMPFPKKEKAGLEPRLWRTFIYNNDLFDTGQLELRHHLLHPFRLPVQFFGGRSGLLGATGGFPHDR